MAKKKMAVLALAGITLTTIVAGGALAYVRRDQVASIWDKSSHWIQAKLGKDVEHVMDEDSVVIVDSTCTEKGSKTWKCEICGAETVEGIEAKGHNMQVHREESTCTKIGHMYEYCTDCDYQTGSFALDPVAHLYVLIEEIPATCTVDGKVIYECTGCGGTKEETVAAMGHAYDDTLTCTGCGFVSQHALWVCEDTTHVGIMDADISFVGTGIAELRSTKSYENFEMTFSVDEVSDVRGAFQIAVGAGYADEIKNTTYVQFNYDRPVVIENDGTIHDYWLNGQDWTLRLEDGFLSLSCENGVVFEDLDVRLYDGFIFLRAENSCALTMHDIRIDEL